MASEYATDSRRLPPVVEVVRSDSTRVRLFRAVVVGDSIVGMRDSTRGDRHAVARDDITRVQRRLLDQGRTTLVASIIPLAGAAALATRYVLYLLGGSAAHT